MTTGIGSDGDLEGTLQLERTGAGLLGNGIVRIAGDLDGDIDFTGTVHLPALPVYIAGDLNGTLSFAHPDGYASQVIIGAAGPSGNWNGTVELTGTTPAITLSPGQSQPDQAPFYEREYDDLGGGAIGEAPFDFHKYDSQPYYAQKFLRSTSISNIYVRYYGPIAQTGTDSPVDIQRTPSELPACNTHGQDICDYDDCDILPVWETIDENTYTVSIVTGSVLEERTLHINGTFAGGYYYRVVPKATGSDTLVCDEVTGGPLVRQHPTADWPMCEENYYFQIASYDANRNGMVEAGDLTAWVAEPQDYNFDNQTDATDVIMLVDAIVDAGE